MRSCGTGHAWCATAPTFSKISGSRRQRARCVTQSQMSLDENERRLLDALGKEARHIDELAEEAELPAGARLALLLTMELKGLVRNHGAQYYVLR